jgi:purine-cytosine permease-like protein
MSARRPSHRFTTGLIFGATLSAVAWADGASPLWTVLVGVTVACLIWFGPRLMRALERRRH